MLRQGGVVGDVVDHRGISIVTGSTEEKRGEEQEIHSKQVHNRTTGRARRVLTRYEVIPVKGETSGKISPVFRVFGQTKRRGKVACSICQGCVADERAAYPDSSRRSEQLSCTKFFHPSYGLFYINFLSFIHFLNLILNRKRTVKLRVPCGCVATEADMWAR